jgi:murein L,D-transpeptidase YafK
MTNHFIKEIYLLAINTHNNGQNKIPAYLFPYKRTDKNMMIYKDKYKDNQELIFFWDNLKVSYDKFIKGKKELNIKVTENRNYNY